MTSFLLKLIGIITMLCDHSGDAILVKFSFLNLIGRIAFPLFAFQLTQSYIHTKNLKKFIYRLLIFSLVSQIPFTLFLSTFADTYNTIQIFSLNIRLYSLNIGFTMLLSVLAILAFDKIENKFCGLGVSLLIVFISQLLNVDYGAFGVLLILILYIFRNNKFALNICCIITICSYYFIRFLQKPTISIVNYYLPLTLFTCLPFIFINLYNGKQGAKVKYLFYIFYPMHLLLLYFINYFIH